jgi:hypothetical protein
MKYACPVCGFNQMPFPPEDHNICSCCGTEFGYHNLVHSVQQLRKMWVAKSCPWFSTAMQPPEGWSAYVQMLNAGLIDITVGGSGDPLLSVSVEKIPHSRTASQDVGTIAA